MVAREGDETLNDEEDFDPEEAERSITQFITRAEELPGPPVAELGEEVAELMRAAWRDVAAVLDGKPHNKVLPCSSSSASERGNCSQTTTKSGGSPRPPRYWA